MYVRTYIGLARFERRHENGGLFTIAPQAKAENRGLSYAERQRCTALLSGRQRYSERCHTGHGSEVPREIANKDLHRAATITLSAPISDRVQQTA